MPAREPEILIIGAGFGGIGAAIELRRHGFQNVRILERADEVGGTWHHNTYPGAACDVPSHYYSYSYAQRGDWTRICSPQEEILGYINEVADEHGIGELLETGVDVTACRWSEDDCRWWVESADGRSWEADAVVVATGQLHQPAYARIPGVERFDGKSFHSAEWDHDYELEGKRVAVIGTGASAVQFVPAIADQVARMTVFQRSGNWFYPRRNRPYPAWLRGIFRRSPGLQRLRRRWLHSRGEGLTQLIRHPSSWGWLGWLQSAAFMRWQLRDPEVRRKVWPDYTWGCKRVLFSSHFLPALQRSNVDLVTDSITEIVPKGLRTEDGTTHEVDAIIWGTGFKTNDFMFPMEIEAAGRSLREAWSDGPHAHLGITVPGFPSMFLMYGPNTNTSGGSIIFYLETQAAYIRQALERVREAGAGAIAVRPEVERESDQKVQRAFKGTAWTRCDSWYRDESGRIIANWPLLMRDYEEAAGKLDPADFDLIGTGRVPTATPTRGEPA